MLKKYKRFDIIIIQYITSKIAVWSLFYIIMTSNRKERKQEIFISRFVYTFVHVKKRKNNGCNFNGQLVCPIISDKKMIKLTRGVIIYRRLLSPWDLPVVRGWSKKTEIAY